MQYRRGKKRRNSLNWLCFTARRSEDSSTQRLHHLMISRQSSHSMTSCPQQITVPFAVCIFGGFGETRHATSKLDDSPQHRNISCHAKQFNVQIERRMFYKVIRHNASPFVCTLYHSTLRWAISRISTTFVCTLYHSTLRWAIPRNATLFVCTLCYSTLPCAIWRNAILSCSSSLNQLCICWSIWHPCIFGGDGCPKQRH